MTVLAAMLGKKKTAAFSLRFAKGVQQKLDSLSANPCKPKIKAVVFPEHKNRVFWRKSLDLTGKGNKRMPTRQLRERKILDNSQHQKLRQEEENALQ